jgi:alginate O-acetyltransferase complex protein AlgI
MLFSSWPFIALFLPVVFGVFQMLKDRREVALCWLVAASLFFYGWFKPAYLLIVILSILFNFGLGTMLAEKNWSGSRRRSLLAFGIAANLGVLLYYKYTGLFLATLGFKAPDILLPLGISFFTFQKIAWLVDSYRRETKEMNFLHYCLFITFFPQLIAGPIVHHKEIIPQFLKNQGTRDMLAAGVTLFIIGLFKKVAIADHMGDVADPAFAAAALGNPLTMAEAWLGALAYTLQIYFDFSGYSDMAVGLGAMFGVRLPLNFFSPYKSADIVMFWRRWHITLSRFLRDYLYIPLGGGRRGTFRRFSNLMLTMLLGGLWHGANWTFAVWGALHGIFLIVCHAWKAVSPVRLPKPLAVAVTFACVMVAWVFFRADSIHTALHMIDCMAGANGLTVETKGASRILRINEKWYILWAALAAALFAPSAHELMGKKLALDVTGVAEKTKEPALLWVPSPRWGVALGLMAGLSLTLLTRVSAFIYFQF